MVVLSAISTSLNTMPNPRVTAGVGWPATWNSWSSWLLPIGAKILLALKKLNCVAYAGLSSAKNEESFRNPVPAVVNTAPDFTLVLKKFAGKSFLLLKGLAPAPSQLISLRPVACSPAVPPLDAPSTFRNSSTLAVTFPVAVNTVACGPVGAGVVTVLSLQAAITTTAASA